MPGYTLDVHVKKGTKLPLLERSGSQSSVYTMKFHGWDVKGKVFDNSLNPPYNEVFSFPIKLAGIMETDELIIAVQTYKTDGRGRSLGALAFSPLPIDELRFGKEVHVSLPLLDVQTKKPNGAKMELALKANFMPTVEEIVEGRTAKPINMNLLPKENDDFNLRFMIHKCIQLVHMPCSAIAVVRFGEATKSTQICEFDQAPVFEEEICFVVNMSQHDIAKATVILEVLNTLRTDEAALVGEFKFLVQTGFVGEPIGWDEPAYEPNTICRAMFKKWVILTHPREKPKNIKGFVNISFSVLQAGQSLLTTPIVEPIIMNVVRNVMRPSEVSAQYKKIHFRIYSAEEMPQMDDVYDPEAVRLNLKRAAPCDPMIRISFCGVEEQTTVGYASLNPQFNTDIVFNIEVPTITKVVKIQISDFDEEYMGEAPIATKYLNLDCISYESDDKYGFDPTFGPCLIPLYGSPKHMGPESHLDYMNAGLGAGIGYRGRLLLEIFTKPSYAVGMFAKTNPTPVAAVKSSAKVLRTQKYVLIMGLLEATRIAPELGADANIEFEISIGEFGYKDSVFQNPTSSRIPSMTPMSDSVKYYFVEYQPKYACIVPMEWDTQLYRLEHLNILEKIKKNYEIKLEEIEDDIQKEKMTSEIMRSIKKLLKTTITECSIRLPDLPSIANELDKKFKMLREMKLGVIVKECKRLTRGDDLDGTASSLHHLEAIGDILISICNEQQCQIPDVTIWMLRGDTPVAYFKSPAHYYLESTVARGKDCLRHMHIELTPMEGGDEAAAQLYTFIWFGTEAEYTANFQFPFDGRISSLAELYENEITSNDTWGMRSLPRPHFSNLAGTIDTPKDGFQEPKGWNWEGPWEIEPLKGSLITDDFVVNKWTDKRYEAVNYEESDHIVLQWCDKDMEDTPSKDEVKLPPGWEWTSSWEVDMDEPSDAHGWAYTENQDSSVYSCSDKKGYGFKRKLWKRSRVRKGPPVLPNIADVVKHQGGWEYGKTFASNFTIEELASDMVRRRRWVRYITSMEPFAVTFELKTVLGPVTIAPPLLLTFPESLHYQVRVHIFQGRSFNSPDISGYVTVYGEVCVSNQTMLLRTIEHQLSPTFDQTLTFNKITMAGPRNQIETNQPRVTVLLYHKGPQGDVFIGKTFMTPVYSKHYTPPRMKWHPLQCKGEHAGDILGIAEIFPTELDLDRADLPFPPRLMDDGRYQLPPGIRPVMKLTRIEILSWGLRKLKYWNAKPIAAPQVQIECGGTTLELGAITNLKVNPNFPKTSTYMDVLLPEGYTYKPPINIRLLDKRENGLIPLVGKYVLTEFARFDPDFLSKQLASREAAEKSGQHDDQEGGSLISDVSSRETSGCASTVIIIEDERDRPTGCLACVSKMVKTLLSFCEVLDETDDWEFLSMYWWSRYYAMQGNRLLYKTFKHHALPTIVVYEKQIELFFNDFSDSIQQFKLQTVAKEVESGADEDLEKDPIIGVYKGSFRIYEVSDEEERPLLYADVPTSKPLRVLIRAYCLEGIMLACNSPIKDKYCDAYLYLKVGTKIIKDVSSLVRKTRNPRFCKIYNFETTLPNHSELEVALYDFEATGMKVDLLIGETKIDIEDRFLSIKRPICSLTERYMIGGPHKWRDFMLPSEILNEFCVASGIVLPDYSSDGTVCIIAGENYQLSEFEKHEENFEDKKIWGPEKERIALYVLLEMGLIRDHVEKRNLYNPVLPGVSQGRLLMWCDIFPWMEAPPEPMNIDPPLPVEMELRVIVYDCINVETMEEDAPEDATADTLHDLVSKSQFAGEREAEVSEIHTRAINGTGAFNWRFIHTFSYAYLERKVIIPNEIEDKKLDPVVTISMCDADPSIAPLPYGYVKLNLANCVRGAKTPFQVSMEMIEGYVKPPELIEQELKEGKEEKHKPANITYLSVFKKKKTLGWWPIYVKRKGYLWQTGMMSFELEVMTKAQAEKRPAGTGRGPPNANPEIDEPIRIPTTFAAIDAKVKMVKFIWKSPNKPKLILGIVAQLLGGVVTGFLLNASTMVQDGLSSLIETVQNATAAVQDSVSDAT